MWKMDDNSDRQNNCQSECNMSNTLKKFDLWHHKSIETNQRVSVDIEWRNKHPDEDDDSINQQEGAQSEHEVTACNGDSTQLNILHG